MESPAKKITECPKCKSRYQVPASFAGKTAECKKCGKRFTVLFGSEHADTAATGGPDPLDELLQEDSSLLLGKIALRFKLITEKQLEDAMAFRKEKEAEGHRLSFRELLLDMNLISPSQIEFLLSVQKMGEVHGLDKRFGELAVQKGYVEQADINEALLEQKKSFLAKKKISPLGDVLIDLGRMTVEQRDILLAAQNRAKSPPPQEGKKESPEPSGVQTSTPSPLTGEEGKGFEVALDDENINARIFPAGIPLADVTVEDIKTLLRTRGVVHGIVGDNLILQYLQTKPLQPTPWVVARGTPPRKGKDESIQYFFDTDPLKIGKLKQGGTIDFKDRGEIPQVQKDVVLARKIPSTPGQDGMNVFGQPIPAPEPKQMELRNGAGTDKSSDGMQIVAKIDGRPCLSADEKVFVFPSLEIKGDVGFETGHVDFGGSIEVRGNIQDGFNVKGGRLSAKELGKVHATIDGDVILTGGVIGGHIEAGGSVRARFVQGAVIEALGDVVVEKGIVDSIIETSGKVIVEKEKILSSFILAKNGLEVSNIGSDVSKPCEVTIGVDARVQKQIDVLHTQIQVKKNEIAERETILEALNEQSTKLNDELTEKTSMVDRATFNRKTLVEKLEESREKGDSALVQKIEKSLAMLDEKVAETQSRVDALFDEQEASMERIAKIKEEIAKNETEIKNHMDDISALAEWSQRERGNPTIKVKGEISAGTRVKGLYSSLVLTKELKYSLIRELRVNAADAKDAWQMTISSL